MNTAMTTATTTAMTTTAVVTVALLVAFFTRPGHSVGLPADYIAPGSTTRLTWSYTDVAQWPTLFPLFCAGTKNSPINLDRFTARFKLLGNIKFTHYEVIPTAQTLTNNGHTVTVTFASANTPTISYGSLPDNGPYSLAQYHLHWGSDDLQGSEHTINAVRYPMELHMVHFKTKYSTLAQAIAHSDGLAVLGIMFEISEQDNPALAPLLAKIPGIVASGATAAATDMFAFSSLLPKDTSRFYRYSGGLTTPTCNEIVTWTVFDQPIPVSKTQIAVFRTLKDTKGLAMVNNYRPPVALNGRQVYRTFV